MDNTGHLEKLLVEMKESLERELHEFRTEMRTRFDTQALRLEKHAGLLQTGARWSSRLQEWADKVDTALEKKDRQIADLADRLRNLESRIGGASL